VDARDLRNDVVQALDVLDIERGVDVYPRREQLRHVQIALGMAAALRVGVGQFVHQHQLGPALEDGVEVHFGDDVPLIEGALLWDGLKAFGQGIGFDAAVGFDNADDDVDAFEPALARLDKHFVGFSHAGRGAQVDLELAAAFPLGLL
jgi:hypothetical protein